MNKYLIIISCIVVIAIIITVTVVLTRNTSKSNYIPPRDIKNDRTPLDFTEKVLRKVQNPEHRTKIMNIVDDMKKTDKNKTGYQQFLDIFPTEKSIKSYEKQSQIGLTHDYINKLKELLSTGKVTGNEQRSYSKIPSPYRPTVGDSTGLKPRSPPTLPKGAPQPPAFPYPLEVNPVTGEKKPPIILVPGMMGSNLYATWNLPSSEIDTIWSDMLRVNFKCDPCVKKCYENCPIPMYDSDQGWYWGGCFQNCVPAAVAHPVNCACEAAQYLLNKMGDSLNKQIFPQSNNEWSQIWPNLFMIQNVSLFSKKPVYMMEPSLDPNSTPPSYSNKPGVNVTAWRDKSDFPGLTNVKGIGSLEPYMDILGALDAILKQIDIITYTTAILLPPIAIILIIYHDKIVDLKNLLEKFMKAGYLQKQYVDIVDFLQAQGYKEFENLFGAPYDWRLIQDKTYKNLFFSMLKDLIEKSVKSNGLPCILVAHSMGGLVIQTFLADWLPNTFGNTYSNQWKGFYIKSFCPINTPFGGVTDSLKAMISGKNIGGAGIIESQKAFIRHASGCNFLLQQKDVWNNIPIIIEGGKTYNGQELSSVFNDAYPLSDVKVFYDKLQKPYSDNIQLLPPRVIVHAFSSSYEPTILTANYGDSWDTVKSENTEELTVNGKKMSIYDTLNKTGLQNMLLGDTDLSVPKIGDGSVPYISQMVPRLWKTGMLENVDSNGKYITVTMNRIKDIEHGKILNDNTFIVKRLWKFIQ